MNSSKCLVICISYFLVMNTSCRKISESSSFKRSAPRTYKKLPLYKATDAKGRKALDDVHSVIAKYRQSDTLVKHTREGKVVYSTSRQSKLFFSIDPKVPKGNSSLLLVLTTYREQNGKLVKNDGVSPRINLKAAKRGDSEAFTIELNQKIKGFVSKFVGADQALRGMGLTETKTLTIISKIQYAINVIIAVNSIVFFMGMSQWIEQGKGTRLIVLSVVVFAVIFLFYTLAAVHDSGLVKDINKLKETISETK